MTGLQRLKLAGCCALCLCACFALAALGLAALQARSAAVAVTEDAAKITTAVTGQVNDLQKPIQESFDLIRASRQMVDHVDKAAIAEQFYLQKQLPVSIAKLNEVLDATEFSVASIAPVTSAATRSLDETTARLQDLGPLELQATKILHDADVVVNSPHIPATLAHADDASAQASAILADGHKVADSIVKRRPWYLRIFGL